MGNDNKKYGTFIRDFLNSVPHNQWMLTWHNRANRLSKGKYSNDWDNKKNSHCCDLSVDFPEPKCYVQGWLQLGIMHVAQVLDVTWDFLLVM